MAARVLPFVAPTPGPWFREPLRRRLFDGRPPARVRAVTIPGRCCACGASLASHVGAGNRWTGCRGRVAVGGGR